MSRDYSPNVVASSFIKQYYEMMIKSPENLHKFYNVDSHFMHSDLTNQAGVTATGPEAIRQTLAELNLKYTKVDLTNGYVDAQKSANNGVFVLVVGALAHLDSADKPFVQTFLLSNQGSSSYYVSNSVFRLLVQGEETESAEQQVAVEPSAPAPAAVEDAPVPAAAHAAAVEEVVVPTPEPVVEEKEVPAAVTAPVVEESSAVEVADEPVSEPEVAAVSAPVPAAAPAAPVDPLRKLNYSDIVKKINSAAAPVPAAAPVAVAAVPTPAPAPVPVPHKVTTTAAVVPATVYAVYVKQLPEATTSTELAELFSQFGNVVAVDYLPVRSFAFVKYDTAAAANAAVAGSKGLMLHGQPVRAEERNVSRAGYSSSGAGGADRTGGPGGRFRTGGRDGGRDNQRDYRSGDRRTSGTVSGTNTRPMVKNTSNTTSTTVPAVGKSN